MRICTSHVGYICSEVSDMKALRKKLEYHRTSPCLILVCVLVPQSCLTLWDPMDCSPPGSSVHGILQARILEWVVMPFSRGLWCCCSVAQWCLTLCDPTCCSVAQLCLTLCDPMDYSMPGFPVHHQLLELTQTHIHRVSDAIQPSHPLLACSPPFKLSQHQGLF